MGRLEALHGPERAAKQAPGDRPKLMFVNLPPVATIRIYTVTGVLVDILNHEDPTGGGRAEWDIRNRNDRFVASGVYFFHVVTPEGDEHVGKFAVITSSGRS